MGGLFSNLERHNFSAREPVGSTLWGRCACSIHVVMRAGDDRELFGQKNMHWHLICATSFCDAPFFSLAMRVFLEVLFRRHLRVFVIDVLLVMRHLPYRGSRLSCCRCLLRWGMIKLFPPASVCVMLCRVFTPSLTLPPLEPIREPRPVTVP